MCELLRSKQCYYHLVEILKMYVVEGLLKLLLC